MKLLPLAFVALLAAAPAFAQTPDIEEVRKEARIHVGAFYLTPTIHLKELGVDTNVFNQAGEPQKDFTFTVSPKADVWVPIARRALISASGGADLVWYADFASERSVDPFGSARVDVYLQRLTPFVGYTYLDTRQRPSYEIDVRSRRVETGATAGIDIRVTPRFSFELAGRRAQTDFDGDAVYLGTSLEEQLDRTTTGGSITARHRLTPLTTLLLSVERFDDRFVYSPERDTNSIRILPGVRFKPRALISGSAAVGFRRFTPEHELVLPRFSGLVAKVALSYTLLGATSFGVSYDRDLNYSFERLQPYYVDQHVGASIRRALGGRFDVLVSADRHRYAYRDLVLLPGADVAREARIDTTWNYAASLGYKIGRDGRIGFGASYWTRDSTTRLFRDYDGLRIGTSVAYGF